MINYQLICDIIECSFQKQIPENEKIVEGKDIKLSIIGEQFGSRLSIILKNHGFYTPSIFGINKDKFIKDREIYIRRDCNSFLIILKDKKCYRFLIPDEVELLKTFKLRVFQKFFRNTEINYLLEILYLDLI